MKTELEKVNARRRFLRMKELTQEDLESNRAKLAQQKIVYKRGYHFDERQIAVRHQAVLHGFAFMAFMLLANTVLQIMNVGWANLPIQGFAILYFTFLAVEAELYLRDAHYRASEFTMNRWIDTGVWAGIATSMVVGLFAGSSLPSGNFVAYQWGLIIAATVAWLLLTLISFVKNFSDYRKSRAKN